MACARDDPFDTGIHSLETNATRIDTPIRRLVYSTSLLAPSQKDYLAKKRTPKDVSSQATMRRSRKMVRT